MKNSTPRRQDAKTREGKHFLAGRLAPLRLCALALLLCVPHSALAENPTVIFSTMGMLSQPYTNALVIYEPLAPLVLSNRIINLRPFTNRTDYQGNFTMTNVVPNGYRVSIFSREIDTVFTNCIPDTNATIYASDYLCSFPATSYGRILLRGYSGGWLLFRP